MRITVMNLKEMCKLPFCLSSIILKLAVCSCWQNVKLILSSSCARLMSDSTNMGVFLLIGFRFQEAFSYFQCDIFKVCFSDLQPAGWKQAMMTVCEDLDHVMSSLVLQLHSWVYGQRTGRNRNAYDPICLAKAFCLSMWFNKDTVTVFWALHRFHLSDCAKTHYFST